MKSSLVLQIKHLSIVVWFNFFLRLFCSKYYNVKSREYICAFIQVDQIFLDYLLNAYSLKPVDFSQFTLFIINQILANYKPLIQNQVFYDHVILCFIFYKKFSLSNLANWQCFWYKINAYKDNEFDKSFTDSQN